mmetsp:Transcript_98978/g.171520  ORF Transcript_98978/g.171520 Transcript_98978/m.171520 type:complete len:535 (-) Transcript_98978:38-1642(-)
MTQSAPNLHSSELAYGDSLGALRAELDPGNTHGPRKLWSALKAVGLEPKDVDSKLNTQSMPKLHASVPKETQGRVKAQRQKVWEELRQSRIREVMAVLDGPEGLAADDVRRLEKVTGPGVRAVQPDDLPPIETLGSMEEFNEIQAAAERKVQEQQQRKARDLGLDFLFEKKRMEDAEAAIAALEERLKAQQKEKDEALKERRNLAQKKAEKMSASIARAVNQRNEWESEFEAKMNERHAGARARRKKRYSTETLGAKIAANDAKREYAYNTAVEAEEQMLERLEDKRVALEERLEQDRLDREEQLAAKREDSQAAFQRRQVAIHAMQQQWVENKLDEHRKYTNHYQACRDTRRDLQKELVKTTSDRRNKAAAKAQANNSKMKQQRQELNDQLMQRHHDADVRREELMAMAIKNENDIYTFREIKYNTFGELQRRRNEENIKRRDAQSQALLFKIAENRAKQKSKGESMEQLYKFRQQVAKDSMAFADNAREGFLKIQSEPDERKVIEVMNSLGFEMPKLPEEEEEEEEEPKKAF